MYKNKHSSTPVRPEFNNKLMNIEHLLLVFYFLVYILESWLIFIQTLLNMFLIGM